jgi:hypothetical protein
MPGNLSLQSQQMCYSNIISKPIHSCPSQNLIITGLKFHTNDVDHLKMKLKQRPNTALEDGESEDQQHKTIPENRPKPPPIYITGVKNTPPLYTAVRTNNKTAV